MKTEVLYVQVDECENFAVHSYHDLILEVGECDQDEVESDGEEEYISNGLSSEDNVRSNYVAASNFYGKNRMICLFKRVVS